VGWDGVGCADARGEGGGGASRDLTSGGCALRVCAVQTLKSICVLAVGNPDAGISAAEFCVAVHLTQARGRCALLGGRFD
jgi:hypothetical protein